MLRHMADQSQGATVRANGALALANARLRGCDRDRAGDGRRMRKELDRASEGSRREQNQQLNRVDPRACPKRPLHALPDDDAEPVIDLTHSRGFTDGDPQLEGELLTLFLSSADVYLIRFADALRPARDGRRRSLSRARAPTWEPVASWRWPYGRALRPAQPSSKRSAKRSTRCAHSATAGGADLSKAPIPTLSWSRTPAGWRQSP